MKLSENWLREWVNPDLDTQALADKLTAAGLEVDAVESVAGDFTGVVVGEVKSLRAHPDADKLRICEVDVNDGDWLTIVCGAANVREGLKVPVAKVGAVLPGDFKIKKAKLRGEPSFGMLCSSKELGLTESAAGLMELPANAPVGEDIRDYLELNDHSIDIDLTPNRSDCLGIAGIAREVGVLTRENVTSVDLFAVAAESDKSLPVSVEMPEACPRYLGRVIEGVNPTAETPLWLQEKLRRSGLRSLGPVVDVTNYVMLELGQPMHAFDLDKINQQIQVRFAHKDEKLTLLDGQIVTLDTETLVIADNQQPLAIAGVMGGEDSAVTGATTTIFLESAFFSPTVIAGKARGYGLHTDSSHRFERGVDPDLCLHAMERATRLLMDIAGGRPGPVTEVTAVPSLPQTAKITLRASRIKRVLGIDMPADEVTDILQRLGLDVKYQDDIWQVNVPGFRFDLALEVDLIEELGRLYGYDRLPQTRPEATVLNTSISETQLSEQRLQSMLVDRGFYEAITYSFVDPKTEALLSEAPDESPIKLANPISADLSVMRRSIWPGLVQAMTHNLNRQHDRLRLFEIGRVFRHGAEGIEQQRQIAGLVYGARYPEQWTHKQRKVDFFDIKADVEALLAPGGGEIAFVAENHPALHPGQSARVYKNNQAIGWVGAIHPQLNKPLDFDGTAYLFELNLASVVDAAVPAYTPVSRYPMIRRDLAVIVDDTVAAGEIDNCLKSVDSDILKAIQLFDVYSGDGVEQGKQSLALAFHLQHPTRTLKDEEVDALMERLTETLQQAVGAEIRT